MKHPCMDVIRKRHETSTHGRRGKMPQTFHAQTSWQNTTKHPRMDVIVNKNKTLRSEGTNKESQPQLRFKVSRHYIVASVILIYFRQADYLPFMSLESMLSAFRFETAICMQSLTDFSISRGSCSTHLYSSKSTVTAVCCISNSILFLLS